MCIFQLMFYPEILPFFNHKIHWLACKDGHQSCKEPQ